MSGVESFRVTTEFADDKAIPAQSTYEPVGEGEYFPKAEDAKLVVVFARNQLVTTAFDADNLDVVELIAQLMITQGLPIEFMLAFLAEREVSTYDEVRTQALLRARELDLADE